MHQMSSMEYAGESQGFGVGKYQRLPRRLEETPRRASRKACSFSRKMQAKIIHQQRPTTNCCSFACSVLLLLLLVLRLDFVLLFLLSFVCQGVRCPFQTEPLTASHLLEINMLMLGENNFHLFSNLCFPVKPHDPM